MRDTGSARQLSYIAAIREALHQCMAEDPRVIVIGEGVPDPKAIFTSTAGLQDTYGARRVFDMPLAENGMTGICIGAALAGMRPVMVHQRVDFALLAMDQIINNAAKWHYMFDGKSNVPLVIRMIVGRGWGQGPQHSQSLQALFSHIPGLKVVMPTTAFDAKGLLIGAIRDNSPTIFIEHRWLHHITDCVPEDMYDVPVGQARLLHPGDDVTVASLSYMSLEALSAAKALSSTMGVSIDLLDMRSLRPFDITAVLTSVRRTRRLVVADTANKTGSFAGEILAQVVELGFDYLKAAPIRVASPDHPVPTSQFMAQGYYPSAQTIADAVLETLGSDRHTAAYQDLRKTLQRPGRQDVPHKEFSGPF